MSNDKEYELIQDDILVAGTSGPSAWEEMQHYATMYGQDAPVEIYEVTRIKVYPVVQVATSSPANGAVGEMPELPEPMGHMEIPVGFTQTIRIEAAFSQDQMQAYARAAVLAEREAAANIDFRKLVGLSGDQCYEVSQAIRART